MRFLDLNISNSIVDDSERSLPGVQIITRNTLGSEVIQQETTESLFNEESYKI